MRNFKWNFIFVFEMQLPLSKIYWIFYCFLDIDRSRLMIRIGGKRIKKTELHHTTSFVSLNPSFALGIKSFRAQKVQYTKWEELENGGGTKTRKREKEREREREREAEREKKRKKECSANGYGLKFSPVHSRWM